MPLAERLNRRLAELGGRGLTRTLAPRAGIDFTSNDSLGLAGHPALAQAVRKTLDDGHGVGSGGSRLLRGNHGLHEELETFAEDFFGVESALFFGSGYEANLAVLSALPDRRDAVLCDDRCHASVKEGLRASQAQKIAFRHNDANSLERAAKRARAAGARELFFAVESLYSMDGDLAPLSEFSALAERYEATLILDEAHATGVLGPTGRGLSEGLNCERLIRVHTCGKALGASGALVTGSSTVRSALINSARPFIFTTAPAPMLAAAVRAALGLIDSEPWRRERLLAASAAAKRLIAAAVPWTVGGEAHILPVLIGSSAAALAVAEAVRKLGCDLRAIRPPTVPEGSARLRISLSCERSDEEIARLADALKEASDEA